MNNYSHVGRPTNEEVLSKNKKKKTKLILIILVLLVLVAAGYLFVNKDSIDFSSIMGNSATDKIIDLSSDSNYTQIFNYSNSNSNALQGSTYTDRRIYFAMASTKSNKDNNTSVFTYNLDSKQVSEIKSYADYYSSSANQSYKINDITTMDGRNYYAAYSTYNKSPISHLMFNMNNVIRRADYDDGLEGVYFIGIAFRGGSHQKFYSLYGAGSELRVWTHTVETEWNGSTANISSGTYYVLDPTIKVSNIVSQGIAIRGYFLYCANQDKTTGINYLNVYDLRTGKEKSFDDPIKLVRRIKLGRTNSKYELESIFFVGRNLYLGYNSSSFNRIYFYKINMTNNDVTASLSKSSGSNGKVILTGNATNPKKDGIVIYSFCNDSTGTNCQWKSVKNSNGEYLVPNNLKMTKTITKKGETWYFLVKDMIGNVKISNGVTVN